MNQKTEITRKVLEIIRPDAGEKEFDIAYSIWWANQRKKDVGGLRLTEKGFDALVQAGIKDHRVAFENPNDPKLWTSQSIIWMDHFIDCPFYVTNKEIYVFSERMAVQLVLFSGNIIKFSQAKANSGKTT